MNIIDVIKQPWPWYVSGIAIAGVMLSLIFFGRTFGFSSNLRTICSMCGAGRVVDYFDFKWREDIWNILFLLGAIGGGFIAHVYLSDPLPPQVSEATIIDIRKLGFAAPTELQPAELYSLGQLIHGKTLLLLISGGLLIGFGTRWAGGCTSGHAITGLSELQLPSLIAVIGFFIGGLIMTHLIFPIIF